MRLPHSQRQPRRPFRIAIAVLVLLLVTPALALFKLGPVVDPRLSLSYLLAISLVTYSMYRHDKRQAEKAGRRVPETTLHLLEILGGWPAAFLAQRTLRHKIVKRNYQIAFFGIICGHQLVALDYLQDLRFTKHLVEQILARFM